MHELYPRYAKRWEREPGQENITPEDYKKMRRLTKAEQRMIAQEHELAKERQSISQGSSSQGPMNQQSQYYQNYQQGANYPSYPNSQQRALEQQNPDDVEGREMAPRLAREQRLKERERELEEKRGKMLRGYASIEAGYAAARGQLGYGQEGQEAQADETAPPGYGAPAQYSAKRGSGGYGQSSSSSSSSSGYAMFRQSYGYGGDQRSSAEQRLESLRQERQRERQRLHQQGYPHDRGTTFRAGSATITGAHYRDLRRDYSSFQDPETTWQGGMEGMRDIFQNRIFIAAMIALGVGLLAIVAMLIISSMSAAPAVGM